MAIPKHKNIRKITINNIEYYWSIKYDEDYRLIKCNIGLVNEPSYRFSFICGANDSHVQYIHNTIEEKDEVEAITPKLVAQAIEFVNNNLDWKNNLPSRIIADSKGFNLA
jgi:hypothetical protein